jgi:hypothetical protein
MKNYMIYLVSCVKYNESSLKEIIKLSKALVKKIMV